MLGKNIYMTKILFEGILGGNTDCGELDDTPPSSPTTILKEGEGQWLSSEVNF